MRTRGSPTAVKDRRIGRSMNVIIMFVSFYILFYFIFAPIACLILYFIFSSEGGGEILDFFFVAVTTLASKMRGVNGEFLYRE